MTLKEFIKAWFQSNKDFFTTIKTQRHLSRMQLDNVKGLYDDVHKNAAPVFVLSTGRCGTKLLTEILKTYAEIEAVHSPKPEPTWHANWAYHNYNKNPEIVKMMIDALRYEKIRDTYLLKKKYVETNNRITFFAYQLAELYPNAKFIHIYRNPTDFANSGINRNWYQNNKIIDEGRLLLKNHDWVNNSPAQKIAMLWQFTNQFIENFKTNITANRIITLSSKEIFSDIDQWQSIIEFLELKFESKRIEGILKAPINKQKKYTDRKLTNKEIQEIRDITSLYSESYQL